MIPEREIKEIAREYGVPVSTIERDYAQNWLLKFLGSSFMALKGGTGIRKVYIENYRFSDDLDFTLLKSIEIGQLSDHIKNAIEPSKYESGINFYDKYEVKETATGSRFSIYFDMIRKSSGIPLSIKIDVTSPGKEDILLPLKDRAIFHHYSDMLDASIMTYSLDEIVAEKTRALFERTRPRDLYDVWYLIGLISEKAVIEIIPSKFQQRNVEFDLYSLEIKKKNFENAWKKSLRHQIKELPDFDIVYNEVLEKLGSFNFK